MAKYRKKPVVIEAVQWDGTPTSTIEVREFCAGAQCHAMVSIVNGKAVEDVLDGSPMFRIETLEGEHWAQINDWIIKGVKGEFYPCKPDIFAATYEAVTESAA